MFHWNTFMDKPNLFSYATSELSQDAFLCWLLSWSETKYREIDNELHMCSLKLIQAFFKKHSKEHPLEINKVEVFKQYERIDVLCVVNDVYPIIIEDKTGTKNHSNQLLRYVNTIKNREFKNENIIPIYFKSQDQDSYSNVVKNGYQPFLRKDILEILSSYNGKNEILVDYREHIKSIESQVESYKVLPIENWKWNSWIGFYKNLQKQLGEGGWDYVSNPNGGFLGFWWHFQGDDKCKQYLQLEENKFCFKICVENKSERSLLRNKWYRIIKNNAEEFGLNVRKPSRFGSGDYMTVCILNEEYRVNTNGILDINQTVKLLKKAQALLKSVQEKSIENECELVD